jgi:hypothetical protein
MKGKRVLVEMHRLEKLRMQGNIIFFGLFKRNNLNSLKLCLKKHNFESFYLGKRGLKSMDLVSGGMLLVFYNHEGLNGDTYRALEVLESEGLNILYVQEHNRLMSFGEFIALDCKDSEQFKFLQALGSLNLGLLMTLLQWQFVLLNMMLIKL